MLFRSDCYNAFQKDQSATTLLRVLMANYILEGIYFYSGFMFFYINKIVKKTYKLKAHDEKNDAKIGDTVRVIDDEEDRPQVRSGLPAARKAL